MKRRSGVVLYETIWLVFVFAVLLGGTHLALIGFAQRKLTELQNERLRYDGSRQWKE